MGLWDTPGVYCCGGMLQCQTKTAQTLTRPLSVFILLTIDKYTKVLGKIREAVSIFLVSM